MKRTGRFLLMVVPCANAAQKNFNLPQSDMLDKAEEIVGIEAYSVSDVTNEPTAGAALQTDAVLKNSFLQLVTKEGNQTRVNNIPLQDLNRPLNSGVLAEFSIPPTAITASQINVGATTGLDIAKVWLLGFHYRLPGDPK